MDLITNAETTTNTRLLWRRSIYLSINLSLSSLQRGNNSNTRTTTVLQNHKPWWTEIFSDTWKQKLSRKYTFLPREEFSMTTINRQVSQQTLLPVIQSVSQRQTASFRLSLLLSTSSRVLSLLLLLLVLLFCSAGCCKSSSSSSDFVCNTDSDTHSVRYDSPGLNGNNLLPSFPPSGVRTVSKTNARFENLCQEVQHLFLRSTVFS